MLKGIVLALVRFEWVDIIALLSRIPKTSNTDFFYATLIKKHDIKGHRHALIN